MIYFDGNKLRDMRLSRGYTQDDLASLIGASARAYQKWEYGESKPNATYLLRIMVVLQCKNALAFASPCDEVSK